MSSIFKDLDGVTIAIYVVLGFIISSGLGLVLTTLIDATWSQITRPVSIVSILIGLLILILSYTGSVQTRGATIGDYTREVNSMGNQNAALMGDNDLSPTIQVLVITTLGGGLLTLILLFII